MLRANLLLLAALAAAVSAFGQNPPTMFPPVRGTREMVAAANNLEVEAGFRMLTAGGNAIDAGVAATLTATVTEQSRVGLGGEIPILIKLAGQAQPVAISGVGVAPAKATVEWYSKREREAWEPAGRPPAPIPAVGIHAAITPGLVDGLLVALEKYGTMSFAQVAQPAIESADGFPIGDEFAQFLTDLARIFPYWPRSYQFFYPERKPPLHGDLVRMPDLAKSLREMAAAEQNAKGDRLAKLQAVHDVFYKGDLAKRMAAFSEQTGGLLAYDDLAKFHAETDTPRSTTYRGYTVFKTGFWAQGPVMLEALNILEGFDLHAMGHNTPQYLHTVIETMKLAFADRDRYYGDPKFSQIPEQILLSKEYAAERRKLIDPNVASLESRPGELHASVAMAGGGGISKDSDTTCVNAMDRMGNAFTATPSGAWIPSVIAGDTGIPFSVRLESFVLTPGHANQLAPGKRPRVTLSPTLVMRGSDLAFTLSTPGGDNQDQALIQVLLNIIDFGMQPQEAVEEARFQSKAYYNSFGYHEFNPGQVSLENRLQHSVGDRLAQMGHKVQWEEAWSNTSAPTVILKAKDGVLMGGADPRRARFVFGR